MPFLYQVIIDPLPLDHILHWWLVSLVYKATLLAVTGKSRTLEDCEPDLYVIYIKILMSFSLEGSLPGTTAAWRSTSLRLTTIPMKFPRRLVSLASWERVQTLCGARCAWRRWLTSPTSTCTRRYAPGVHDYTGAPTVTCKSETTVNYIYVYTWHVWHWQCPYNAIILAAGAFTTRTTRSCTSGGRIHMMTFI